MKFESICNVFPKEEKYWPCLHPSKALPFFIRTYLRQHFGGIFAANDLYKKNTPKRLGIATKPFEMGDPISTISMNHFIKTQELITKIDYGQTYFNGVSANATTDQITINATGDYEITYCGCTILSSGTTTKINLQLFLNNSSTGVFLGNSKHVLANECFSKSYMKYLTSGTTVDLRFAKDNGDSTSIFWDSHSLTVKRIR